MMRRVTMLVLSLIVAMPAAAQIYQWRDAEGRVHYSDTPPPTDKVRTIKGATRAPATTVVDEADKDADATEGASAKSEDGATKDETATPAAPKPKTLAEKEAEFRQRRAAAAEAEAKAAKERERAEALRRDCDRARGQLAGLMAGQRFARYSSSGDRELLDDAGRSAEISRTQEFIDKNCR